MGRRFLNLLSGSVVVAGGATLSRPAQAAPVFACTDEQWDAGAAAANDYCSGASFAIDCSRPGIVVVTIIDCPEG